MALGLLALLLIIVAMDLVVWQPLSVWAEKFRYEFTSGAEAERSLGMLHAIGMLGPSVYHAVHLVVRPLVVTVQGLFKAIPPFGPRASERLARVPRFPGTAALATSPPLSTSPLPPGLTPLP